MKKPDFFHLVAPEMPKERRTIIDPDYPDQPLEIELQALDEPSRHLVVDLSQELLLAYAGDPEEGIAPTKMLPAVKTANGKTQIQFSQGLCYAVATILTQQTGKTPEERVTAEQLFWATITWRKGWRQLFSFAKEMQAKADEKSGNDSPAATDASSALPSDETSSIPQ